jgi:CRISPR-associated protein Csd1
MILAKLKEYADTRMELPPPMYRSQPVRWFINLNAEGQLEGFTPLGGTSKSDKRGMDYQLPTLVRAGKNPRPILLADSGEFVLGIPKETTSSESVTWKHTAFKELVHLCAEKTGEPLVKAVCTFLESWIPDLNHITSLASGFSANDTLTFRVNDVLPVDLRSVQEFWAKHSGRASKIADVQADGTSQGIGQCLVTGLFTTVEDRMPEMLKGLVRIGGQANTALISANASAFVHYGLKNSLTSPISRDAAERFTKALNHLIDDENSRLFVGTLIYTFWTRKATKFNAWKLLSNPKPEDVKLLFQSSFSGNAVHSLDGNQFYALALSASKSRAVVRDWLETTIPEAEANLRRWFQALSIVDELGQPQDPASIYRLVEAVFKKSERERKFDAAKAVPTRFSQVLLAVALKGINTPREILEQTVKRCFIGTELQNKKRNHVMPLQAALIKLALSTQPRGEVFMELTQLDPDPPLEPRDAQAYHCGRLLAELEAIQRAALGKINATIVDRYYGSASSTPQSGFAPLLSGVQAHLSKLRKNRAGAYVAKQKALEDILQKFPVRNQVPQFPSTLTMREQGIFAIGYYHQRAENRASAIAAKLAAGAAPVISP